MSFELLDFEPSFPGEYQNDDSQILRFLEDFARQREAYSDNTINSLIIHYRKWGNWCDCYGRQKMPIKPDDFLNFMIYEYERGLAASSIDSMVTSICFLQRQLHQKPLNEEMQIARELKMMRRRAALSGDITGQAVPFHLSDLKELTFHWKDSDSLTIKRNLAFLYVAYNSMLRIAELARIQVKHLAYQKDGTIILTVPYTKTSLNVGVKALSKTTNRYLTDWLHSANLSDKQDAFVFCGVHRSNKAMNTDKPLTRVSIEKIFSDAWLALEREDLPTNKGRYARWSGHSCRVGAAQDLLRAGSTLADIMHEGNWRTPNMAMNYVRNIDATNSPLLNMLDK